MPPGIVDVTDAARRLPGYGLALSSLIQRVHHLRAGRPENVLREEDLAGIARPVPFVWGDADRFGSPGMADSACRALPDADLAPIAGGHAPWFGDPARCGEAVSLLVARSNHESSAT